MAKKIATETPKAEAKTSPEAPTTTVEKKTAPDADQEQPEDDMQVWERYMTSELHRRFLNVEVRNILAKQCYENAKKIAIGFHTLLEKVEGVDMFGVTDFFVVRVAQSKNPLLMWEGIAQEAFELYALA
jgi:hypothetical protein